MEVRRQTVVEQMITAGALAGAYSVQMRATPEAVRGLERMRLKWSARAATLADEICARVAEGPSVEQR